MEKVEQGKLEIYKPLNAQYIFNNLYVFHFAFLGMNSNNMVTSHLTWTLLLPIGAGRERVRARRKEGHVVMF